MVLITGSDGFLGSRVAGRVADGRMDGIIRHTRQTADLEDWRAVKNMFKKYRPRTVIHTAALVGGINFNSNKQFSVWQRNTIIDANIIKACVEYDVDRLIVCGSVCMYGDKDNNRPYMEYELLDGIPSHTNFGYGMAKRNSMTGCETAHMQHSLQYDFPVFANMYGYGQPKDAVRSHVVGALSARLSRLSEGEPLIIWGDGTPIRDMLHVYDAANAVVAILESKPANTAINISTGIGISIKGIAEAMLKYHGKDNELIFDASMPNGQKYRVYSAAAAEQEYGWRATTSFEKGLSYA